MHNSLIIRILIAVLPLLTLAGLCTLSGCTHKNRSKQRAKRAVVGALRGLSHGPQIKI